MFFLVTFCDDSLQSTVSSNKSSSFFANKSSNQDKINSELKGAISENNLQLIINKILSSQLAFDSFFDTTIDEFTSFKAKIIKKSDDINILEEQADFIRLLLSSFIEMDENLDLSVRFSQLVERLLEPIIESNVSKDIDTLTINPDLISSALERLLLSKQKESMYRAISMLKLLLAHHESKKDELLKRLSQSINNSMKEITKSKPTSKSFKESLQEAVKAINVITTISIYPNVDKNILREVIEKLAGNNSNAKETFQHFFSKLIENESENK